ncbi:uncharacterized protein M421DRAFT_171815 [Didymella exigua CBS 183.55]|uniref:Uncharacterized protein n=1 Tax=Didymella exigua CBS 183.55 TaxID=1150837 RepID=A0A6A5RMQ8_9PLEO|nr:uncharacterized protein M421DRAFT_171815 [Didymella exigua CBS 183.55]KAF1927636.1 hypothetical protein M421DRAFT_171815 [Didymella exigua CBS 183.55]
MRCCHGYQRSLTYPCPPAHSRPSSPSYIHLPPPPDKRDLPPTPSIPPLCSTGCITTSLCCLPRRPLASLTIIRPICISTTSSKSLSASTRELPTSGASSLSLTRRYIASMFDQFDAGKLWSLATKARQAVFSLLHLV